MLPAVERTAMLRYALVDGERSPPVSHGRGICPSCGGHVIARCGTINAHHWAHEALGDCDAWSEGIGLWHRSWQDTVRPEFVEVAIGPHRADLLGAGGTIIELQHSPIGPVEIAERERFYGKMVWVFDATFRFAGCRSGERFFFSLGRTKHIAVCTKPVLLDFGETLVEVEAFTEALDRFSGFGLVRSREWFAGEYLADRRQPGSLPPAVGSTSCDEPWSGQSPVKRTAFPTHWQTDGRVQIIPGRTPFIPLDAYHHDARTDARRPAWAYVITRHPQLACGWTEADLWEMKALLNARPMILEGRLRLMPSRADEMQPATTVETLRELLSKADAHIAAGRIPVLKDETCNRLLRKAEVRGRSRP